MQKTTFKTRLLALLTAAFMVVMCVPFAAFADSPAEHKTISVQWTTTSGEKLHEPTTVAAGENVTAPRIEEGYVWSDVDYVKNTYNAGDTISFAEMEDNISYWYQGEGSYAFRKVEAPKPTTKTIKINYYSEAEKKQIAEVDMTVAADATSVNSSKLTAPQGYELVESGDFTIRDGYVYAAVRKVKAPATTKTIKINYYSEAEEKQIAEVAMTVAADATYVNTSALTAPEGYELAEVGDLAIRDGYVYAAVNKIGSKTVKINYYSEAEEKQIKEEELTVAPDATCVNTSKLTAPTGYELVEVGDLPIRDGYVYAAVRKVKAPATTKTIKINYYSEAEKKQIAEVDMTVAADATSVNSSKLTAPQGYELVESGDFTIRDGYVYAAVRKVKAPATTKTIKINYYSEAEEKQIAEVAMTVAADATYVNTSALTAPEGYELAEVGDLAIRDGYVYAAVNKIGSKTVKINYYSEAEEKQIKEEELTVAPDATCVNTSKLTAPTGYELVEVGDLPIRDGYVYAAVRKVSTKEVKINFYCPEEKKQVAEPTVVVNADATCVNSSAYAALVPAGYELVEVGDMPIRDGYVYAEVRKVATKTIKINYYSEEEEKQIAEVEMTVPADATYVNTSKLTAPAGYKLVLAGDLPIRDGYVYAAVRKVPTTTIKISYVDEATDKEVGTEDLVVNQGTTVVNFNVLKSVPAGYELCEVGDFYVGNGSAKVMVRKTKSNNGSSSSSASSSSNTTNTSASNTTNTSASQKQVVKAAAAPANTTKVLPKTGATNAAPLIGGSLAVVALLMGYGVYGLVLRKKD